MEATAAPQAVKIAYAEISEGLAEIWGAKGVGAFEKYDLTAYIVYISSVGIVTAALLGIIRK